MLLDQPTWGCTNGSLTKFSNGWSKNRIPDLENPRKFSQKFRPDRKLVLKYILTYPKILTGEKKKAPWSITTIVAVGITTRSCFESLKPPSLLRPNWITEWKLMIDRWTCTRKSTVDKFNVCDSSLKWFWHQPTVTKIVRESYFRMTVLIRIYIYIYLQKCT